MSYFVFSRKYRPQKFSDVVAQRHITETPSKAIRHDRVSQAYLFCGMRGTGKTSVARILAKRLNCSNPQGAEPCDNCDTCLGIIEGRSLDILEIDAASNTSVDDIRELRESIKYAPVGGKHKVYIIDEVHRLSPSAFDALLKTLEEPPAHAIFIFATTEVHKVPQTILSRCQRYDFRRVPERELMGALQQIADKENLSVTEEALSELAKRADGSLRDALSTLDQVASWQRDSIDMQLLTEALGILPRNAYREMMALIREQRTAEIIPRINEILNSGIDASEFVRGFQEQIRNLLLLKAAPEAAEDLGIAADEIAELGAITEHYSLNDLLRIQNLLVNLEQKIRDGFDPQINLELALLKLANMDTSISFKQILEKFSAGEISTKATGTRQPESKKKLELTSPKPIPQKRKEQSTVPKPVVDIGDLKDTWTKFLDELKQTNRNLQIKLSLAHLQGIDGDTVSVAFDRTGEFHIGRLQEPETRLLLEEAVKKVTGHNLKFKFYIDKNLSGNKTIDRQKILFADSEKDDHPTVTKAMEVLDAVVVDRKDLPGQ